MAFSKKEKRERRSEGNEVPARDARKARALLGGQVTTATPDWVRTSMRRASIKRSKKRFQCGTRVASVQGLDGCRHVSFPRGGMRLAGGSRYAGLKHQAALTPWFCAEKAHRTWRLYARHFTYCADRAGQESSRILRLAGNGRTGRRHPRLWCAATDSGAAHPRFRLGRDRRGRTALAAGLT